MGNERLELDKTMGPRPPNFIGDRRSLDGFTKARMYGCNLILRQPSLRNALQGGATMYVTYVTGIDTDSDGGQGRNRTTDTRIFSPRHAWA